MHSHYIKSHTWQKSRKGFCRYQTEHNRDAVRFLWYMSSPTGGRMRRWGCWDKTGVWSHIKPILARSDHKEASETVPVRTLTGGRYDRFLTLCGWFYKWGYGGTYSNSTAKNLMLSAGMNMYKLRTNLLKLKQKWQESPMDCTRMSKTNESALKVLGLVWRPTTKYFVFYLCGMLVSLKDRSQNKVSCLLLLVF